MGLRKHLKSRRMVPNDYCTSKAIRVNWKLDLLNLLSIHPDGGDQTREMPINNMLNYIYIKVPKKEI